MAGSTSRHRLFFELESNAEWTPLDVPMVASSSFVAGDPHGEGQRLRYFRRRCGGLLAKAWFGPHCEGDAGRVAPRSLKRVLDEAMGLAAWQSGHPARALDIDVWGQASVPLETVVLVAAWVESVVGRLVRVGGQVYDREGRTYAAGRGVFSKPTATDFPWLDPGYEVGSNRMEPGFGERA